MPSSTAPVPSIVEETVVAQYVDPLPELRRTIAASKAQGTAVLAAARRCARNVKRPRSHDIDQVTEEEDGGDDAQSDAEDTEQDAEQNAEEEEAEDDECEGDVDDVDLDAEARLERLAKQPFSLENALQHAEIMKEMVSSLHNALSAEQSEREGFICRIDEWASKGDDGFDLSNPAHAAALEWFKDNTAFEHCTREATPDDSSVYYDYSISVVIADTLRVLRFAKEHSDAGVTDQSLSWAPAKYPIRTCRWSGVRHGEHVKSLASASMEKVTSLFSDGCPLHDVPSSAVLAMLRRAAWLEVLEDEEEG